VVPTIAIVNRAEDRINATVFLFISDSS